MTTVCGTPDYLAPEVISVASGSHSRKSYDSKVLYWRYSSNPKSVPAPRSVRVVLSFVWCFVQVDVWAIGVIFYTMLCGYPPFWSENMAEMLHLIRKVAVPT